MFAALSDGDNVVNLPVWTSARYAGVSVSLYQFFSGEADNYRGVPVVSRSAAVVALPLGVRVLFIVSLGVCGAEFFVFVAPFLGFFYLAFTFSPVAFTLVLFGALFASVSAGLVEVTYGFDRFAFAAISLAFIANHALMVAFPRSPTFS